MTRTGGKLRVAWTESQTAQALASDPRRPVSSGVLGHRLLVLSDAHLGATSPEVEEALLGFLDQAPTLGDCLLLNGDVFDFWFAYRRVIPRQSFHVAAEIRRLRRRIPVVMVGGNHDRWGEEFWERDLGVDFAPLEMTIEVGHRAVLAVHGDGLTEAHWSAEMMHRITRHPLAIALWKLLHPDVGFWLVDRMSHSLGNTTRREEILDRAAIRQREWAERRLARASAPGCVVMGHTHRPALSEPVPGRQYVNPGAWMDGYRYAVITASGAELSTWK